MSDKPSDSRVFFAAERTLLAWMRTGLTVMALGFVVARFGLFLAVIAVSASAAAPANRGPHWPSHALGIALVLFGAGAVFAALYNHRAYVRSLPAVDVPRLPIPWLTTFLCLAIAIFGVLLAGYLAVT